MRRAIVCIGNRLVAEDCAALEVYDLLRSQALPEGLELVEGGLAGLDLLPLLERGGRVVFVDQVRGFAGEDEMVVVDREEIVAAAGSGHYGHEAGLPYLMAVLPRVCEGEMAEEVTLVGLEGRCSAQTIARAAATSLAIAEGGGPCSG